MFERFFPLSFFDIMMHLYVHLGREGRLGGPIQYRWMYPFKRYIKILKGYVKNHARPEGCIAKCYLVNECVTFRSRYLKHEFGGNYQNCCNQDFFSDVILEGRPISRGKSIILSNEVLESAHRMCYLTQQ
ncbi:hypothetical protein Patl1_23512 [Pistacia atlantica]|uniref:Uncharacterized protein n=1 Tax=Pistacia atlantica TaxID=434234 RepID=A0ACC1A285_9ROSI|nr:hypothetical protein Patl1_23512 [Pistacia atlantica]